MPLAHTEEEILHYYKILSAEVAVYYVSSVNRSKSAALMKVSKIFWQELFKSKELSFRNFFDD